MKVIFYCVFLQFLIKQFLPAETQGKSFDLNVAVASNCVFNVMIFDCMTPQRRNDFDVTERFISNNQVNQRWVIGTVVQGTEAYFGPRLLLLRPVYFKESCSVNILIAPSLETCYASYLIELFGSRLYDKKNNLIIIYGTDTKCSKDTVRDVLEKESPIVPDIYFLTVSSDMTGFEGTYRHVCTRCSGMYRTLFNPPVVNLERMRNVSLLVKKLTVKPFMAVVGSISRNDWEDSRSSEKKMAWARQCLRLYKIGDPLKVDCIGRNIMAQILALKFNLTVEYFSQTDFMNYNQFLFDKTKYYSVVGLFASTEFQPWLPQHSPDKLMTQVQKNSDVYKFMYCERKEERESFSFLFWTVPFDLWSWTLIGITSLALTLVLKGQWFQVFAILMRQECTVLNSKKHLIIFILATIVFTYGYEGIISSWIIVPPPLVIVKDLKELLDRNYTLIHQGIGDVAGKSEKMKFLFKKEGIPLERLKSSLSPWNAVEISTDFSQLLLQDCNVATDNYPAFLARLVYIRMKEKFGVSCHMTKNTIVYMKDVYQFHGPLHESIGINMLRLQQFGILNFYDNLMNSYILTFWELKYERIQASNQEATPFVVSEWKILSIFLLWAGMVGMAGVVWVIEVSIKHAWSMYTHRIQIRSLMKLVIWYLIWHSWSRVWKSTQGLNFGH